jgi:hypothetical protein
MKSAVRLVILLALLFVASTLPGDTVALGVLAEHVEEVHQLTEAVESGGMDVLFDAGHVVFDITLDPDDDYRYRAVEIAESGGADYLLLFHVEFMVQAGRRVVPVEGSVEVLMRHEDIDDPIAVVAVSELPHSAELDPLTLSEALGRELAGRALARLQGGR